MDNYSFSKTYNLKSMPENVKSHMNEYLTPRDTKYAYITICGKDSENTNKYRKYTSYKHTGYKTSQNYNC